jgi:hypothetical protein
MLVASLGAFAYPQATGTTNDTGSKILSLNMVPYPEGFELIYGKRPYGPATRELVQAKQLWDQYLDHYRGLVEVEVKPETLAAYEEWGMGKPVFYNTDNQGKRVAFPNAVRSVHGVNAEYVEFPAPIIATWQIKGIEEGFFFLQLHPFVPPQYAVLNMENGQKVFEKK